MAKTLYVYSTLSCAQLYTGYSKGGADLPVVAWQVHVAGGANVAGKHLITPLGVATKITEDQHEQLKACPVFLTHVENGFIQVKTSAVDPEVAAADMEGRDESAPLVVQDFVATDAQPIGAAAPDVTTPQPARPSRRA